MVFFYKLNSDKYIFIEKLMYKNFENINIIYINEL